MNEDRITELYEGALGTGPEYQVARQRVHWICSQCKRDDVLDVGSSQGIVSILLAREGRTVTGVDNESGAIEFARQRREEEEEAVRQRLDFIQAEASSLPFDPDSFDTVILGELLEHLVDQRPPLKEAARVLRPGGQLIVTTPYGLFPYHDHKEPLYLAGLAELLLPEFEIEEVELIDRYLGIVGRARPSERPRVPPKLLRRFLDLAEHRLAVQDERAYQVQKLEAERDLLSHELERKAEKLDQARSRNKELWEERSTLKSELRVAKQGARKAERLEHQVVGLSRQAQALAAIRSSRSYRLMGAMWRVNDALRWRPGRRQRNRTAGVILEPGREAEPGTARERYESLDTEADRRAFLAGDRGSGDGRELGRPSALRVAAIADPWLEMALGATCRLITFRPDNWPYLLEAEPPDLLLVQSAWRGNAGSWEYKVPSYTHPDAGGLSELVDWCRASDVPTVFWHTEGATEIAAFGPAASLFDIVLAASSGVAERLAGRLGDGRAVSVLPLAAQPLVHRPHSELTREPTAAFVGDCSRGGDQNATEALLETAAESPSAQIFHTGRDPAAAAVPERLQDRLKPYTPPRELVEVFQSRSVILAGAPADPAFIPAPVFEALSCGAGVISAPNPEIPSLLGDVVPIASTAEEAASHLERLLHDDDHRLAVLREARRLILSANTYQHRLSEIALAAGRQDAVWSPPTVAVLTVLESRQELESFLSQLAEQSRRPDELVIAFENGDSLDGLPGALDDIKVSFESVAGSNGELSTAETSRRLCQRASSQWISWFDRKRRYQPDHLATLLESTFYTDAVVAVARSRYSTAGDGEGQRSVPDRAQPDPGCLLIRADAGRARGIPLPGEDGMNALGRWVRDEAALIQSGEHELLTATHTPEG